MTVKIRFMCLKHCCDVNIEGAEHDGLVTTSVLMAHGDGTYSFDFSNCWCPEFDSLTEDIINSATEEQLAPYLCQNTWTAVMYDNFTQIGG